MEDFTAILKLIEAAPLIDSVDLNEYITIDLSKENKDLTQNRLEIPEEFEKYIESYLSDNKAKVAFGGYLEERKLYQRSTLFNNSQETERNIHIGLDLWIKSGTIINCPLDGKVHSFKNNEGLGDYGPTIILEHTVKNHVFHTLYGHLSLESITDLSVGKSYKKGERLAALGNYSENGNYAPHLHFQIIKKIESFYGDYPGVCSKKDLDYYSENCPDPKLILKI